MALHNEHLPVASELPTLKSFIDNMKSSIPAVNCAEFSVHGILNGITPATGRSNKTVQRLRNELFTGYSQLATTLPTDPLCHWEIFLRKVGISCHQHWFEDQSAYLLSFSSAKVAHNFIKCFTPSTSSDPVEIILHGTPVQVIKVPPRPMIYGIHPGRDSS
ncbi:MAG: hypothetical protein ACREBR_03080 [bacterium]